MSHVARRTGLKAVGPLVLENTKTRECCTHCAGVHERVRLVLYERGGGSGRPVQAPSRIPRLPTMPPEAPRARDQHPRVRFAPTPEEEQLWEWAGSLRRAALRAILWPLLLPGQLLLAAEALLARALGVFVGILQGSLCASTAIAQLLLSRGGLKRLLFGQDGTLMDRVVSVPVPGTPPHLDAGADHSAVNSEALAAALTAAAASAPATEPAVPQPLTPPPVAAGADAFTSSPDWPAVPAVPSPAVRQEGVQPHSQYHPALAAAYAHALAQAPADTPVPGPPSFDAAVADWQQDLAAAAAAAAAGAAGGGFAGSAAAAAALAAAAAERGGAAEAADEGGRGREGGGPAAVLSWQQLQAKKAELRALREREERLLAAFEPAGPQAQQAAAAWLQGSEALLATASSAELAAAASAAAANLSGTAGSEGRAQPQQQAATPSVAAGGSPAADSPAQQQKKAETETAGKEAPVATASSVRPQASRGSLSGLAATMSGTAGAGGTGGPVSRGGSSAAGSGKGGSAAGRASSFLSGRSGSFDRLSSHPLPIELSGSDSDRDSDGGTAATVAP